MRLTHLHPVCMWWEAQSCFINICTYCICYLNAGTKAVVEGGLVMLQKQQDKRTAMLECDREQRGRCKPAESDGDRETKWVPLFMLISQALAAAKHIACGDCNIIVPFLSAATHTLCKYGYDLLIISIPVKCILLVLPGERRILLAGSCFCCAILGWGWGGGGGVSRKLFLRRHFKACT